ncbi:MAG TPA: nucleotidyltransferase family protein, partial [Bryobacteraceae bacterium]|nr:nucleotidyltransferase family protein [Bryobacteraceae bacterium]
MNPLKARYLQLAALLPGGTSDHPVTSPPSLVELAPFLKLASQQRMIPALGHPRAAAALNLPPEVAEDLARILELNTRRNQDLKAQTIDAVEALNCEGIDPLVLKGAAALLDDHYKIPGGVVIADVDMVVPEKELARCYQVLQRSGFVQTAPVRWDRHHLPPLLHEKTSTTLELHRWLAKRGVQDLLPA